MGFVEAFCHFIQQSDYSDLSANDTLTIKNAFRDTIGCILAGTREEAARITYSLLPSLGGTGPAPIIGTTFTSSPPAAALANGIAGHCLDYDDLNHPMMGHPSTVLVPAILAAASLTTVTGKEAMLSYAVGVELAAKLGKLLNPYHYEQGWHATSTLGTLAAAAAVARLLRLPPHKASWALGIAASQASGMRGNFGSMTKAFHAGHAAQCGLTAAVLASEGFSSCPQIAEREGGFLSVWGTPETEAAAEELVTACGSPWELTDSGICFKQYPCCAASHPVLDLVISLRTQRSATSPGVKRIICRVDPHVPHIMTHDIPSTPLEGKFSLRYCVATAMIDGAVTLESFSQEALLRETLSQWWPIIDIRPDLKGTSFYGGIPTTAEVTIEWQDGSCTSGRVDVPKGNPQHPLSQEELKRKFEQCASGVLPTSVHEKIQRKIEKLETLPSLDHLIQNLVATDK